MLHPENAERIYGHLTPQEVAGYVEHVRAEALKEGARTGGRTPLWAVGLAVFTPLYIVAGGLAGCRFDLFNARIAIGLWALGWIWLGVVMIRERRSRLEGRR